MKKTNRLLTKSAALLLVMFITLCSFPASAAGNADLKVEHEELASYSVGDTIKITITAAAGEAFFNTRVLINLNKTAGPCYLDLVDGSVYIDGAAADKVNTGSKLTDTNNKYLITNAGLLTITLGDLSAGDIRVITFYATIAEGSEKIDLNIASLLKNNGVDVITTSPLIISIPLIHPVKEAGIKTSENLTSGNGKNHAGDTIKYSITAYNNSISTTSLWEDVTVTDTLPDGVPFAPGSVEIDGIAASTGTGKGQYTYDEPSGTLTIYLGDIGKESERTVTFRSLINNNAYGKTIINTAEISGMDEGRTTGTAVVEVFDAGFTVASVTTYTVTVTYNANGGTGTVIDPDSPYNSGDIVMVMNGDRMDRDGYTFSGWNTEANGNGTSCSPGDKFTITDDVTLYAQWEKTTYSINTIRPSYTIDVPKTGDTSNLGVWAILLCVSLAGIVNPLLTVRRRKQRKQDY